MPTRSRPSLVACGAALILATLPPESAVALSPPELTPVGSVRFPLTHQFSLGSEKITSSPLFTLSSGISERLEASLRVALDSRIDRRKTEWEPRLTYRALQLPVQVDLIAAYNSAATSVDTAMQASAQGGPFQLRSSLRGFSSGVGVAGPTAAVAAGLDWQMNDVLQASVDYGGVVASQDLVAIANHLTPLGLVPAWRLGVEFEAPNRHAVQVYVTDAPNHTLQGLSHGTSDVLVGFEYRIPLHGETKPTKAPNKPYLLPSLPPIEPPSAMIEPAPFERTWFTPPVPQPAPKKLAPPQKVETPFLHTIAIDNRGYIIREIEVQQGNQIRWVNQDRGSHSVTAPDWDSRWLKPGQSYTLQFLEPGLYPYYCKAHPEHRGIVRVIPNR